MMKRFLCAALLLCCTAIPGMCQLTLGQLVKENIVFEGQYRQYYMYMPKRHLRPERPLVVVLHGYGQQAYGYVPEMLEVAEREGFAVCYPIGLNAPRTGKPGWYIGYPQQKGMKENDDEFICFLTREIRKLYRLDNAFLTGMSNGGDMCYLIARKHPGEFHAIASVAGQTMKWIDDTLPFNGPVPFMEVHGTADRSARWEGDITGSAGWGAYLSVPDGVGTLISENGCEPKETLTRLPKKRNLVILHTWKGGVPAWEGGPQCEVLLYEIKGGIHSWALADMDTCSLIWEFFSHYQKPAWSGIRSVIDWYPFNRLKK